MSKALVEQQQLKGVDGLRAIACLAVICHHLIQRLAMLEQDAWVQQLQSFLLLGNVGVSIFFVLSGFLLALPFWRRYLLVGKFPSIRQYLLRRAARIVPGYYVAFVVCMILIVTLDVATQNFWMRSLAGLTFTAGFHYMTFFPSELNGPFWSIGFEVISYLLMPLFMYGLFRIFRRNRSFTVAMMYWLGVLLVILAINHYIHQYFTPSEEQRGWQYGMVGGAKFWMPNYNPIGFFGHFTMGIIASGVVAKLQMTGKVKDHLHRMGIFDLLSLGSLITALLFIWFARHVPEFDWSLQNQPFFFPYFTVLVALFLASVPYSRWVGKGVDNRFFRYTAKVSFGLYIWHYIIVTLVAMYWIKDFQYMGMVHWEHWAWISLGIVGVSYMIATLSYYFIEKPVLHWARNRELYKQAQIRKNTHSA